MVRISIKVLVALLAVAPIVANAQDKGQIRNQAKEYGAKFRSLGEPRDRCALGASFGAGPVVVRTYRASVLKPGDKLMALNGTSTVGKTPDEVVGMLRQLPPSETVSTTVGRDKHSIDLRVQCSNARDTMEPMLTALDFAARGKFDECVSTISRMANIDTGVAFLRLQCASVARNAASANVSELAAQAMEMAIEDAYYVPSLRAEASRQLRGAEAMVTRGQGIARYEALIEATKRWPGDESLYVSSTPDWALFRRNAEKALRNRLIDPESARIEWPHGFLMGTWKPLFAKPIDGYWTCGSVNARNRMGGYTGTTAFVVVLDPSGYVKYSEVGESKDFDMLSASCNKSTKLLPAPPTQLSIGAQSSSTGSSSLADELKKLLDLRNSGALTEAEFQAAKAKLIGGSPP